MFDIFHIGFLKITILDILDVAIVSYIVYKLYTFIKGTIASQIFVGLIIIMMLSFTSQAINLKALNMLLKFITDFWIIAFIVLFQPEIRRLLVLLATGPLFKVGFRSKESEQTIKDIVDAVYDLARAQHGALLVIVRTTGMRGYSEAGILINAKVSKDLIMSIFYPKSPLHDGAIIIRNNIVEAARCALPLSSTLTHPVRGPLGMRHRAALGVTESSDVLAIIVSEEGGSVSTAFQGDLEIGVSKEKLRDKLTKIYRDEKDKGLNLRIRSIFASEKH